MPSRATNAGTIYVSGEVALEVGGSTMRETIDRYDHLASLRGGLEDDRLRLRPYLTEVADYKRGLRRRQVHEDVVKWPNLGEEIVHAVSGQSDAAYLTGCPLHVPD